MNEDQRVDLASRMAGIESELKNIGILFAEFKHGLGVTVQTHDQKIVAMEGKVDLMLWIAAKIATPILAAIGASLIVIGGMVYFKK